MTRGKYPIGIHDFEDLRKLEYIYIDKTPLLHELVTMGKVYFLSRPRRFGKSLLVSTLQCLFEGKRELFKGLAIDSMDYDWTPHPVIRLDMNAKEYKQGRQYLIEHTYAQIIDNANRLGVEISLDSEDPGRRLQLLINAVVNKYNKPVAVLIDEYDKPLLETITNKELHDDMRNVLKAFYGVLKSAGGQLHFTFLTGVTKFSQVSVFSDLNHLEDISQVKRYGHLLGITQAELEHHFESEIIDFAEDEEMSREALLEKIKAWYNGYLFHHKSVRVYNPFSVMNFFKNEEFINFWFQTGTPSFLLDILASSKQDLPELEGYQGNSSKLTDFSDPYRFPIAALYQSGYLTIKSYDKEEMLYTLGYPNREVKYSFLESLITRFTPNDVGGKMDFHAAEFRKELRAGNIDAFMQRLQNLYSRLPYDLNEKKEKYYQTVFYLVFELMGQNIHTEVRTANGRCDAIVETKEFVYIIEMKLDGTVEEALQQIDEKGYALPYKYDPRKLFKIGLAFDKKMRTIGKWMTVK